MSAEKNFQGRFSGTSGIVRRGTSLLAMVLTPCVAWASTDTASTASTGTGLSGVGRVLGMMLFAYLALKWFNRNKDKDEDEPRGFLGLPVRPWVVWLVVIGGLALLMARSG